MERKSFGLIVAVLAVALGVTGCRSLQPVAPRSPERGAAVVFDGCGHRVKPVAITAERRTLRDAFAGMDPGPVLNAGGYPVVVFARLNRPEGEHFVATELITDTTAGEILLNPGERIELVPWTQTDLMRGLKEVTPPTVGPAPEYAGDLTPLFDWRASLTLPFPVDYEAFDALDTEAERARELRAYLPGFNEKLPTTPAQFAQWSRAYERAARARAIVERPKWVFQPDVSYLRSLYNGRWKGQPPSLTLDVTAFDQFGVEYKKAPAPDWKKVERIWLTGFFSSTRLPRLGLFTGIPGDDDAILAVERTVEGRVMSFMIPIPEKKNDPKLPARSDVLDNALLYDGDVITVAPPENFPIVQASRRVTEHVIQPMIQRRKAFERCGSRP